ncbi:MAG: tRNA (adenosine(37)-N6)-threonylcarbamoyltransferase complex ATPase subunit type 1 TsaE [Rhodospirillales bacterium]|jgi:tRNA threonylcarbamoyladenosine biosynthesis protein TsaE|nr:tRNA (adenosine(37)-N6)-threonylcarbamoyltransferase complex ATPase subunit type 1 TsaE [Rhodospirillaceae bacterium]MDP6643283.1 tRNA (adenosine(37)-N6)-threonylcarbamoyltransferase complex ATPase subunit type 1 TsaE [Rhodospirillales bacterium]MDP6841406.1 tRNA (adenosine(37)-N6)-threonylcarbamoyltransferase complex ATPase subunit type 1 TsaE [Rhodospirillales bacterium]|tara:strand:+ start:1414 stop:1890 length:477 start_codon:yes stop_codon:yes gene_type:complete
MTDSAARTVQAEDESRTRALAAAIAGLAEAGDVIALKGELGSGKTVFARAFIAALGGLGEVPSPTFTLVQIYDLAAARVFHFDLYRLEKPEDALELDIDDAFADGISLIEWPEKLGAYLPPRALLVSFGFDVPEFARRIELEASGAWADRIERIEAGV